MPSGKKKLLRSLFIANAGCDCGRPKPSDVHQPTPLANTKTSKHKTDHTKPSSSSSSSCNKNGGFPMDNEEEDQTSTTVSFGIETNTTSTHNSESEPDHPKPTDKVIRSTAVVKDSNDPYQDFRHSMLQMILDQEIYSKDDLQKLLHCFLELNSPCHHGVIIQAFTEIWNEVISSRLMISDSSSKKPCVGDQDRSHDDQSVAS